MSVDQQNTVSSKASVFGLLDEAPMTALHYYYWLLASGGTLLDGFSVVSLGIAIPLLKQEMTVTPVLVGLIGSALVLGAMQVVHSAGQACDSCGSRRNGRTLTGTLCNAVLANRPSK